MKQNKQPTQFSDEFNAARFRAFFNGQQYLFARALVLGKKPAQQKKIVGCGMQLLETLESSVFERMGGNYETMLAAYYRNAPRLKFNTLTKNFTSQEEQILNAALNGKITAEISREYKIQIKDVIAAEKKIYTALNVSTPPELFRRIYKNPDVTTPAFALDIVKE
jgi:DNA-binding NarL/FixJ family response regulator